MRGIIFAAAAVTLTGCAMVSNISADDIRNEEHLRASGQIPLNIEGVTQAMYKYDTTCRSLGRLDVRPGENQEAVFTMFMPGWSQQSVALLIDLKGSRESTEYQGYTYYITWKRHLDRALYALSGGLDCDR